MNKHKIKEVLSERKLICDGAFGTYYAMKYDTQELPERANTMCPRRVIEIHEEYLAAGAELLRTNTYASNTVSLQTDMEQVKQNLRAGYQNACAAREHKLQECMESARKVCGGQSDIYIAADIGPIAYENVAMQEQVQQEYVEICRTFLEEGAEIFLFETFGDLGDILPAIEDIGDRAFVIVQFSVNQFGYSNAGLSARRLIVEAAKCPAIDGAGFNCGVGPGHMQKIISGISMPERLVLTALPNAGYPQKISNRMIYANQNVEYFAAKVQDIARIGADIVGGCCGTTPEYIRKLCVMVECIPVGVKAAQTEMVSKPLVKISHAFNGKKPPGEKVIAVELAPPFGIDDEKLMDAAHMLQNSGVDVLTFPDSPSGRTRADAVLMAEKVSRETGICVMPHICCRDKNAIAIRSQLLGAHINGIYNFLVVTGDPIPSPARSGVKSVFNFDSVGLMHIMADMNEEHFAGMPVSYGGAINQTRRNLDVEINRVKKKMAAGAEFFLTQPVSTREGVLRLKQVKEETGAKILCGIMPFVSFKNALFMKNEMTGIEVTEEVLARYREDMTREEGEAAGVALARDVISWTKDFADGYYFSFPFNRVHLLEKILRK